MSTLRPTWLAALALCTACSSAGRLHTPRGSDRVRDAWHIPTSYLGQGVLALVIANSRFPCGLPSEADPEAITGADMDYYVAWNREGALVVGLLLYRWGTGDDWSGSYPLQDTVTPEALDAVEPRAAMAAFHAIWEAEVSEEDGIYRQYEAVDEQDLMPVPSPGSVELQVQGETMRGSFTLDSIDVSGTFTSQRCSASEADLLQYLDLFQGGGEPLEDSATWFDGAPATGASR